MANISYKRLRVVTVATASSPIQPRLISYNGVTPDVDGSTDVLTVANASLKATWDTATNSPFRVGDLVLVVCTDGAVNLMVEAVTNGVPSMQIATYTDLTNPS